ncbi:MAG: glycosyltransferase family 2 protein [Dehalococcoidia bacterium]
MRIVVVVPSYNERENIGPMIEALQAQFVSIAHEMHVLVVDDNSPDNTADVVREAAGRWPSVHLLSGEKRGLGVAYVRGITYALDELGADAVMQMDADFSHDPADVPRLVAALDGGADFVIGSRYVKGGRAPADWGIVRRAISLAANLGARVIAGFYRIHDCTNGFRAIKGDLLRRIDLDRAPGGYVVLMYLIYQAMSHGAKVVEVPVVFSNRTRGESKLRASDAMEFFVNAWWIRYDRRETFYRLASGGLSGVATNLGALALLHLAFGVPAAVASALALEIAILYSFVWRQAWVVVSGRPLGPTWPLRFLVYQLVSMPSFALTFATFLVLTRVWDVNFLAAQALGILPALLWNYFLGERVLERVWVRLRVRLRGYSGEFEHVP